MSDSPSPSTELVLASPESRMPAWAQGIVGTLDGALQVAKVLADSGMVPDKYAGKPHAIMVAAAMGQRLGIDVFTAMNGIAVINGKPTIWGDLMLAICQRHPEWGGLAVRESGSGESYAVVVEVRRKGQPDPYTAAFSYADAKRAGLAGKQGPWSQYPARMVEMRARSWALRAAFADALAGMMPREEMEDLEEVHPTSIRTEPQPARTGAVHQAEVVKREEPAAADKPARRAPHPALKAGNDLWAALEQQRKGLGSQVIGRLAKIHGADAPKAIPAERLDAFGEDLGVIAGLKTEAEIEDELGAMEVAAREGQP